MFKLGVITDEISQEFDVVTAVARKFNLVGMEIRSVWSTPPQDLSAKQIQDLKSACEADGFTVPCIASPFYKCAIDSPAERAEHIDILKKCMDVADELSCKRIRVFTFWRDGLLKDHERTILRYFEAPTKLAGDRGFELVIENEHSTFIGLGAELAPFLEELDAPHVRACWDPCNSYFADTNVKPYPDDYEAVASYVTHVHVKDAHIDPKSGEVVNTPIGDGVVDLKGQLQALKNSGYAGYVNLETHWRPESLSENILNRPGGEQFSEKGEAASTICLENLQEMIAQLD